MRVACHENNRHLETTKTAKTAQTATNKELSAGFAEITETTDMMKTTGIRRANHGYPKPWAIPDKMPLQNPAEELSQQTSW